MRLHTKVNLLTCFFVFSSCATQKQNHYNKKTSLSIKNVYIQSYVGGQRESGEIRKLFIELDSVPNNFNLDSTYFEKEFHEVKCFNNNCVVLLPQNNRNKDLNSLLIYYNIDNQSLVDTINSIEIRPKIYMP